MLTRLRIKGFKNLVDVDIPFGSFTCIAGLNGVGKSNLFDALMFLRDLTDMPIVEAATRVRDPLLKSGDIRGLFSRTPEGFSDHLSFEAEIIVPTLVTDDFGRKAKPVATFLTYALSFKLIDDRPLSSGGIQLESEVLNYIPLSKAAEKLLFDTSKKFRKSTIRGPGKRTVPFITTEFDDANNPVITLHTDGGRSGKPFKVPASTSPKTILGGINTESHPTVLAARREMQSWRLLQLEPSALRRPDDFTADAHVSATGEHLPSTLLRLNENAKIANRLAELIPDVKEVSVDEDEGRRLRTLLVAGSDKIRHPARALSDGTLRFLALSVISMDPDSGGLICLEEPENGIHPSRVPIMVKLLQDMSNNPDEDVNESNPLRQVIINTHSPLVVSEVKEDSLIVAKSFFSKRSFIAAFQCIEGTWRESRANMKSIAKGDLMTYLAGTPYSSWKKRRKSAPRTVRDYAQQQQLFEFMEQSEVDNASVHTRR